MIFLTSYAIQVYIFNSVIARFKKKGTDKILSNDGKKQPLSSNSADCYESDS